MGQRVGYQRVSTYDQNTARQLDGVELDKVFTDHASGNTKRPELARSLDYVREASHRARTDRQGRPRRVRQRGPDLHWRRSAMNTLLLSMLGAVAEFERAMILERQREGIAIAKAAGKYKGRQPSLTPSQVIELRQRLARRGISHRTGRRVRDQPPDRLQPQGRLSATSGSNDVKFGRPSKMSDTDYIAAAKTMKADGHTGKDIARFLGSAGPILNP